MMIMRKMMTYLPILISEPDEPVQHHHVREYLPGVDVQLVRHNQGLVIHGRDRDAYTKKMSMSKKK